MNKSYEYSYGDRNDFETAIIPIHTRCPGLWYSEEHWLIAFFIKSKNKLVVYDPKKKPITHWHRTVLHHLIRFILPNQEWQTRKNVGQIVIPKEIYNGQAEDDGTSCGIYI